MRCWKDCGLANLPFDSFPQNQAWVATSLVGDLAKVEPKTFRFRILHVAANLVRRQRSLVLRIDESWPWKDDIAAAFDRLRSAFP